MDFRFTRHILSCNNIDEGKEFKKDFEPGLSILGIIETAMFAKHNPVTFHSYDVCVSNLYRTWCTAFILYGTNFNKSNILNLWICPYLKEKIKEIIGIPIQRGNFPKEIQHMANKFLRFLQVLYKIKEMDKNEFINKLKNDNNIINFLNNNYNDWYDSLPNEIILRFPIKKDPTQYSGYTKVDNNIIYKKVHGKYTIFKNCVVDDFISNTSKTNKDEWLKDGNLKNFMNWYNNLKPPMFKAKTIHIITHSGIMRNYLKSLGIDLKSKKNKDLKSIGETNCWTFVTNSDVVCLNNIEGNTKQDIIQNLYKEIILNLNTSQDYNDIINLNNETIDIIKQETESTVSNIEINLSLISEEYQIDEKKFKQIIQIILSEKYGFKIKKYDGLKRLVKLLLMIVSLKKGVPENPLAKKIEQYFKQENMSLCSTEGSVKSAKKTPIKCSKGMNGGKKTRKKRTTTRY